MIAICSNQQSCTNNAQVTKNKEPPVKSSFEQTKSSQRDNYYLLKSHNHQGCGFFLCHLS